MKQYTDILREILAKGRLKVNRTGIDALSIKGPSMRFNMDDGFPLETLRPIFTKGIIHENLWFLEGTCNNETLLANGVKIWDQWALKEDVTETVMRQGYEMAQALLAVRNANRPEGTDEYTFQQIVEELTKADLEDGQKGLPVNGNPGEAKTWDELHGAIRVFREAGVAMHYERVMLPKGYLGPIYGVMWRHWVTHDGRVVDQIQNVLRKLGSENPKERYSRSLMVTGLNPAVTPEETMSAEENIKAGNQALAPCHTFFHLLAEPLSIDERYALYLKQLGVDHANDMDNIKELYVTTRELANKEGVPQEDLDLANETLSAALTEYKIPKDQLSLIMYQRSADFPIGVPFNIAGYALLLHMFAHHLGMKPAEFVHHFGDAHIYVNQIEGVKELLAREDNPDGEVPALPTLLLNPDVTSIFDLTFNDIKFVNYNPIKPQINFGEIAV